MNDRGVFYTFIRRHRHTDTRRDGGTDETHLYLWLYIYTSTNAHAPLVQLSYKLPSRIFSESEQTLMVASKDLWNGHKAEKIMKLPVDVNSFSVATQTRPVLEQGSFNSIHSRILFLLPTPPFPLSPYCSTPRCLLHNNASCTSCVYPPNWGIPHVLSPCHAGLRGWDGVGGGGVIQGMKILLTWISVYGDVA